MRTLRVTLLLAALLTSAIFLASLRWHVTMRNPGVLRVEVSGGSAKISWWTVAGATYSGPIEWDAGRHSAPIDWFPAPYRRSTVTSGILIPLYLPAAWLALTAAILFWIARAPIPGRCPRCAYDRTGLAPATPCPECGNPFHDGA